MRTKNVCISIYVKENIQYEKKSAFNKLHLNISCRSGRDRPILFSGEKKYAKTPFAPGKSTRRKVISPHVDRSLKTAKNSLWLRQFGRFSACGRRSPPARNVISPRAFPCRRATVGWFVHFYSNSFFVTTTAVRESSSGGLFIPNRPLGSFFHA